MLDALTKNSPYQIAPPPNTDNSVIGNTHLCQLIVPLGTQSGNLDPARCSDARDTPFTIMDTVKVIASKLDLGSLRSLALVSKIFTQGSNFNKSISKYDS